MRKNILIIGGGASGMVAAIAAARAGADVTVLEQKEELGKKILATGNGRCNYTNLVLSSEHYYSEHKENIGKLIAEYPPERVISFFEELGILSRFRDGYAYPYTDQASNMRDALVSELEMLGVHYYVDTIAKQIYSLNPAKGKGRYSVKTNHKTFYCDALILATGGKSGLGKHTACDGFALIAYTKHTLTTLSPALVPLKGQGKFFKKIAGIRSDATVSALVNGVSLRQETGEVQFTDYGISGIPVFQISRIITQELESHANADVAVGVDFMPSMLQGELEQLLLNRKQSMSGRTMKAFLNGIWKDKLASFLLYTARLDESRLVQDVTDDELMKLARICKTFTVGIVGAKEFQQSQVTAGGVPLTQVSEVFESIYHPQLYFTGEVLDVDGICGGYNLHFAWASGMIVGAHCSSDAPLS